MFQKLSYYFRCIGCFRNIDIISSLNSLTNANLNDRILTSPKKKTTQNSV